MEFADARRPRYARCCVILVRMPEGHAIGIKCGHAVIAPAPAGGGLTPRAVEHRSFALAKIIQRVTGETSGITNAREDGWAGRGIANGCVSILINGYARHPAP